MAIMTLLLTKTVVFGGLSLPVFIVYLSLSRRIPKDVDVLFVCSECVASSCDCCSAGLCRKA